jgi:hypothetical protein
MLAVGDDPQDESTRVLILAKSNLGRLDVPALKYRIEGRSVAADDGLAIATSGVAWLGEAPGIGAGDIFRAVDPDDPSDGDRVSVLREALNDGPMTRKAMKDALRDAGFTVGDRTLQRTCARLGVVRHRAGFGGQVTFALPGQCGHSDGDTTGTVHNVHIGPDQGIPSPHSGQILHTGHGGQHVGGLSALTSRSDGSPPPEDSLFWDDEESA